MSSCIIWSLASCITNVSSNISENQYRGKKSDEVVEIVDLNIKPCFSCDCWQYWKISDWYNISQQDSSLFIMCLTLIQNCRYKRSKCQKQIVRLLNVTLGCHTPDTRQHTGVFVRSLTLFPCECVICHLLMKLLSDQLLYILKFTFILTCSCSCSHGFRALITVEHCLCPNNAYVWLTLIVTMWCTPKPYYHFYIKNLYFIHKITYS